MGILETTIKVLECIDPKIEAAKKIIELADRIIHREISAAEKKSCMNEIKSLAENADVQGYGEHA